MSPTGRLLALVLIAGCSLDSAPGRDSASSVPSPVDPKSDLSVSMTAKAASDQPRAFTFTVLVADTDGGGPGYAMSFGDGKYERSQLGSVACASPPPSRTPVALATTLRFEHVYETPGDYVPGIEVITSTGCDGGPNERAVAHVDLAVP